MGGLLAGTAPTPPTQRGLSGSRHARSVRTCTSVSRRASRRGAPTRCACAPRPGRAGAPGPRALSWAARTMRQRAPRGQTRACSARERASRHSLSRAPKGVGLTWGAHATASPRQTSASRARAPRATATSLCAPRTAACATACSTVTGSRVPGAPQTTAGQHLSPAQASLRSCWRVAAARRHDDSYRANWPLATAVIVGIIAIRGGSRQLVRMSPLTTAAPGAPLCMSHSAQPPTLEYQHVSSV
mmetsp:Transcript_1580/g.4966  ORF Transcript_1580/g.4966 Transcript_1580/m.4966 type:complete len:244 (-) Transcript_1580:73-804(-)